MIPSETSGSPIHGRSSSTGACATADCPSWRGSATDEIACVLKQLRDPNSKETLRDFLTCYPIPTIMWMAGPEPVYSFLENVDRAWRHPFLFAEQELARAAVGRQAATEIADRRDEDRLW